MELVLAVALESPSPQKKIERENGRGKRRRKIT